MRILITGISGFVARHFVELLSTSGKQVQVAGIYNNNTPHFTEDQFPNVTCNFHKINLLDNGKLRDILSSFNPDYVLHLASKSSVAYSWKHPEEVIKHNTGIFIALIENIRLLNLKCKILSVGSAEEYGNVQSHELPLVESLCPNPASPYGTSRVMQQKLVEIYSKNYGLDIVHTRSFNHIGPFQHSNFVVSSFAKQIAEQQKNGNKNIEIKVGNINVTRDFTDVRDVVKAYHQLLIKGQNGGTYNVCSGKGIILKDLIEIFSTVTGNKISCEVDPKIFRPFENIQLIGSYGKINRETGWEPAIPIKKSLEDLLEYWRIKN